MLRLRWKVQVATLVAFSLTGPLVHASSIPGEGCQTSALPDGVATVLPDLSSGLDVNSNLKILVRGNSSRRYLVEPGVEEAILPVIEQTEAGIGRLEREGWAIPGDRLRPVSIEIVSLPGWQPRAGLVAGSPAIRIDRTAARNGHLDQLAAQILHQFAHLILSPYGARTEAWWNESTARHLASRAENAAPPVLHAPLEGLAGPSSSAGFGEAEFADAVAAALGEQGLLRLWEEARGGSVSEGTLRRHLEQFTGKSLEEFILEHALVRESAAAAGTSPISSGMGAAEWEGSAPRGVSWWVKRLRPQSIGGGEFFLDARSDDYLVRLLVSYRDGSRPSEVVELTGGRSTKIPLGGADRISLVAIPRNLDRESISIPSIRFRGIADFPFKLDGTPSAVYSDGAALVSWSTESHSDLLGWRIERREVRDGKEVFSSEFVLPTSDEEESGFSYRFVDTDAALERSYVYEVEGITSSGVLAEGFKVHLGSTPRTDR